MLKNFFRLHKASTGVNLSLLAILLSSIFLLNIVNQERQDARSRAEQCDNSGKNEDDDKDKEKENKPCKTPTETPTSAPEPTNPPPQPTKPQPTSIPPTDIPAVEPALESPTAVPTSGGIGGEILTSTPIPSTPTPIPTSTPIPIPTPTAVPVGGAITTTIYVVAITTTPVPAASTSHSTTTTRQIVAIQQITQLPPSPTNVITGIDPKSIAIPTFDLTPTPDIQKFTPKFDIIKEFLGWWRKVIKFLYQTIAPLDEIPSQ